ncbi:hypothetical protein FNV43_RR13008 [Rhamnella rubrinervis]|uniref:Uncharacterized protein n=1 Tax=Rhamnella rubrinervis TaxID=2594499 RepID=A0A8K0H088_9ROSA|nr:hypothetical protein FNV43_RR13008 [Rhamnella rubrinervis]
MHYLGGDLIGVAFRPHLVGGEEVITTCLLGDSAMREDHYRTCICGMRIGLMRILGESHEERVSAGVWRTTLRRLVEDFEEDPEEDSLGTDEYIPRGYTPDPVDPEDFDPWDEPASD